MTILKAITCGNEEELQGKEVAIRNGKLARCPGCAKHDVLVTENKDYGLLFISHHKIEASCGGSISACDYSGEPLRVIASIKKEEPEAVLH